jgi:hypothetical protein
MDYSFLCVVTCGSSSSFNSRMSAESFLTTKLMQCKYELKFLIMNIVCYSLVIKLALHICILFNRASNKPRLQTSKMPVPLNCVFTLQRGIKCRFKIHTMDKEYINIKKTFHLHILSTRAGLCASDNPHLNLGVPSSNLGWDLPYVSQISTYNLSIANNLIADIKKPVTVETTP